MDITDLAAVERAVGQARPDVVINAAAYNFVDQAESEPEKAFAVNKTGSENLARAAAEISVPVIQVSTDYVFDGTARKPYLESATPNPLSAYGNSKLAGERAVFDRNSRAIVVRSAWIYHIGGRNFPLTMLALKDKPRLTVVNDQFGSPTYAPHLARKIIDLAESKAVGGIYHMAGDGCATWFDFAKALFRELGVTTPLEPIAAKDYSYRAPRPRYTVLATEKGERWKLPRWEQGLSEFVKALKSGIKVS